MLPSLIKWDDTLPWPTHTSIWTELQGDDLRMSKTNWSVGTIFEVEIKKAFGDTE